MTDFQAPEGAQEPEPAGWLVTWKGGEHWYCHAHASEIPAVDQARIMGGKCEPLYRAALAAPAPQAPVPMTEAEIGDLYARWWDCDGASFADLMRAVERHHGIPAPKESKA